MDVRAALQAARTRAVQSVLGDTKNKLEERGERIRELGDKSEEMSRQAGDFLNLAKELNKKSSRWW